MYLHPALLLDLEMTKMPRYYRTFLATGLLTAMTLPALAQTATPTTPETVSPAPTETTPPKVVKHHVTHNHHATATKKTTTPPTDKT